MTLTLEQKEKFFRNQKRIQEIILSHIKKKKLTLFGQKAVNEQIAKDLRKDTFDYDIFSQDPKATARRLERKLDRKLKGNFFETKEAIHKGTHKVVSRIGKRGYADVSKPEKKIPTIKKKGILLATLEFQKSQIRKSLKDPKSKFRHEKDREGRARIKISQQRRKKSRSKARRSNIPSNLRFRLPSFSIKTGTSF